MYDTLQPCDALWKVRTRRAQSVFWRCEHADEGGSNPRMWHLGSVCRARSPHSCELCLGHPVRSPQSALAVRIPANPASDTPFAVRSPHSQSAFRPSLFGGPVRSPHFRSGGPHTARATHVAAITFLQAWAYSRLSAAKAVVEDDFTLSDDWPSIANLTACVAELEAR